jgi:hypothetical protein
MWLPEVKEQFMSTALPYVYKFKGRFPALIVCGLMTVLLVVFAGLIASQGGGVGVAIFFLVGALFFLLIGGVFFIGKTNIVIDNESISRTILGKRFKVIQWKDIERITVFPVRGAAVSSNVTGYNIVTSRNGSNLSNTKKIFFSSQGNDLFDLLECMNIYIARFNIKAEQKSDSTTVIIKSI